MIDALIIFAILIVLLFARLPVGFAMAGVGIAGFAYYVGWPGTFAMIGRIAFDTPQRAEFAVVPLFVLMGNFITRAGLADEFLEAFNRVCLEAERFEIEAAVLRIEQADDNFLSANRRKNGDT